jgi:hypothetical protein
MVAGEKGLFYSKKNLDYQKELRDEFDDFMPMNQNITCSSRSCKRLVFSCMASIPEE